MGRKKEPNVKRECTPKQLAFVREYLIDHNGKEAAIRAGYAKKNAKQQAHILLQKEHIIEALQEMERKVTKKCEVTAERIVKELALIAFFDIGEMFNENGTLKPIQEMEEEITRVIKEIEMGRAVEMYLDEYGEERDRHVLYPSKIKINDKLKALELLGKYKGMFREKLEVTGKDGGPIETQNSSDYDLSQLNIEELKTLEKLHEKASKPSGD